MDREEGQKRGRKGGEKVGVEVWGSAGVQAGSLSMPGGDV